MMAVKKASMMFIAGVAILALVAMAPARSAEAQSGSVQLDSLLKQSRVDGMQMQAKNGGGEFMTRVSPSGYLKNLSAPRATYLPVELEGEKDPESVGRAFVKANRDLFVPAGSAVGFTTMRVRKTSVLSQVRLAQTYTGLPVYKAEMMLQVRYEKGVSYVLSDLMTDFSSIEGGRLSLTPTLSAQDAVDVACGLFPDEETQAKLPELMIFCPEVVGDSGDPQLVWQTVVMGKDGSGVAEEVLVNAHTGAIALRFSKIHNFRYREVYDGSGIHADPGDPVRTEGSAPSLIPEADYLYDYLGDTYDTYLDLHMRDSIDNKGMLLSVSAYYPVFPPNAYWSMDRMYFAEGLVADDILAHEYTHGVTAYESMLIYYGQSGAINECFSDVWGELVDQTNGVDIIATVGPGSRWLLGEDSSFGAIRNMADPTELRDPDKMSSIYYVTDPGDQNGVHTNANVGNKLCYLLTDGDTFNNFTVEGLGYETVAKLFYECQVNLLTAAADYADLSYALLQAASYMGVDRDNVLHACQAVEIAPLESYVITYKGCRMDVLEGVNIFVQDQTGKTSIKIKRINEFPSQVVLTNNFEHPRYGLVYLASRSIPNLNVMGDVAKLYSEITISDMVTTGSVKSVTMKDSHLSCLTATAVGSVKMIETPVPGRSFISVIANGLPVPPQFKQVKVKLVGLSIKAVDTPGQSVKIKVSSKKTQIFGQDRFIAEAGVTDVAGGDQVDVSVKGGNIYGWQVARGRLNKVFAGQMKYSLEDGVKRVIGGYIGSPEANFSIPFDERKEMAPLAYSVWLAAGDTRWLAMNNPKGALINNIRSSRGTMAFFVSGFEDTPMAPKFISTVNTIKTGSTQKGNEGAWGKAVVAAGSKIGLSGDKAAIYDGRIVIISNLADLKPANDDFVDAIALAPGGGTTAVYNGFASFEEDEPSHGNEGFGASVWWTWTAMASGWADFSLLGSDFNTVLSVYEGTTLDNLVFVASNDNYYNPALGLLVKQSLMRFRATVGTTYYIAADGSSLGDVPWVPSVTTDRANTLGNINLSWGLTAVPENDDVADAIYMATTWEPEYHGNNYGATTEALEPVHSQFPWQPTPHSVWFRWEWPTSGTLIVDPTETLFDAVLAVYKGNMYSSYTLIDTNQNSWDGTLTFIAERNTPYWIVVAARSNGVQEGDYTLSWRLLPSNDNWQNAIKLDTLSTTPTWIYSPVSQEVQMSNLGASTQWQPDVSIQQEYYDAPPYYMPDPDNQDQIIPVSPYRIERVPYGEPTPFPFFESYRDPNQVEEQDQLDRVMFNSVWFEWVAPVKPLLPLDETFMRNGIGVAISTYGSDFDTVVAVHLVTSPSTNTRTLSYQTIAVNDDAKLAQFNINQQGPVKTSEVFLDGDKLLPGARYLIEVGGVSISEAGNIRLRIAEYPYGSQGDMDWWNDWWGGGGRL